MAAPRKHPVDELIRIATEATALMWRCYDNHIKTPQYDRDWELKAQEILARCTACDERLARLKLLRVQALGPKRNEAAQQPPEELTLQRGEAEWNVRRFRHLLICHEKSSRRDGNWKAQQLRIMTALRNAMIRLVEASEEGTNGKGDALS